MKSLTPAVRRIKERWYPLKEHAIQRQLITDNVRYKVVPAGRRSGKTERAKRFIAKYAMKHPDQSLFIAAPTREQVKKIYWKDMKLLCFSSVMPRDYTRESDLILKFPNNSTIQLIGLDKPQRIEGSFWSGGVIDEIADVKPTAWYENVKPALNTFNPENPDYRAWCWLIGVPDGLNHYYDLCEYAKTSNDPEWKLYTWHSADILPPDIIEQEKRSMSERQFKQEYEASFETATGRIYETYSNDNLTNDTIKPHEQLLWMHDFNFTPMSSAIGVIRNNKDLFLLDEIVLTSAITRESAIEFIERYKDHQNRELLLYGDPAGRAGEKHGHASDYTEMENLLRQNNWKVKRQVKPQAPSIKDRQNAVRAKIKNAVGEVSLFVNPQKAVYCHKGLSTVQARDGSTFLEKDSDSQHITTAIGYCIDYIWPINSKKEYKTREVRPSVNRW